MKTTACGESGFPAEFLGDGAPANWSQFGLHFPKRVEVLDWYHAVEHLWAAAKDRWGEDSAQVAAWVEARKQELWEGGVEAVLTALKAGGGGQLQRFTTSRPTGIECATLSSAPRAIPSAAARWGAPASG